MALIQANLRLRWLSFSANTFWLFCSSSRMSDLCTQHGTESLNVSVYYIATISICVALQENPYHGESDIAYKNIVSTKESYICTCNKISFLLCQNYEKEFLGNVVMCWSFFLFDFSSLYTCLTLLGHRANFSSVSFRATAYSCTSSDTTTICRRHKYSVIIPSSKHSIKSPLVNNSSIIKPGADSPAEVL